MYLETIQDVTCPWCFIGKRRLDRALASIPGLRVERRWRSFQLDPGIGRGGMPMRVHVAARFGNRSHADRVFEAVTSAGAAEGIALDFAAIERIPNTRDAHRLIRFAAECREENVATDPSEGVVDALFRAHFEQGRDIGCRQTLAAIADGCGMGGDRVEEYLAGEGGHEAVMAEDRELRRRGFSAIPCTIINGSYAVSGAQASECYLPLFELAQEQARHRAGVVETPIRVPA